MVSCKQVFAQINGRDNMVTFLQVSRVQQLHCLARPFPFDCAPGL
jgi:hypothetical protein